MYACRCTLTAVAGQQWFTPPMVRSCPEIVSSTSSFSRRIAEVETVRARIAEVYREFRRMKAPDPEAGFYRVGSIDEVRSRGYALTPGRSIGAADVHH